MDSESPAEEPNWELYKSDLKVSRMTITRTRPSLQFDIPVHPRSSRYRRGDGPPPPKIDIQLVHDTDAFIVDKIILPLEPFTQRGDPRQRRAYYIVGWPDLPAARPVVDCAKALDYVSPRVMEDWEYKDLLRREAEREQAEKAAQEAAAARLPATAKGKGVAVSGLLPNGKKKPGRRPKHPRVMQERLPTPQLDSEQEEMLARRKHGPSLSTPQKSRIAQLEAEMEILEDFQESVEEDGESALQRQLEDEVRIVEHSAGSVNEEEADALDLLPANDAVSGLGSSSRASSARLGPLRKGSPSRASSITGTSAAASARNSPLPPVVSQVKKSVPTASSTLPRPTSQKPVSTTPIPLPTFPSFGSKKLSASPAQTPRHGIVVPAVDTRTPSAEVRTPKTAPLSAGPENKNGPTPSRSESSRPAPASNGHGGFTPTNGSAHVGGYFPRVSKRSAEDSSPGEGGADTLSTHKRSKKERKRKASKVSQTPPRTVLDDGKTVPVEQEYVVKRLEGHSVVDDVHYFQVRWEGEWPPDQNPTWEPQENISAALVRKYLKREATRNARKAKNTPSKGKEVAGGSTAKSREKQQPTLASWAKGYNSVSEAFEGRAELGDNANKQGDGLLGNGGLENDDPGDADELFIVDERKAREREQAAAERNKTLGAQFMAQLGRRTDI